MATGPAVWLQLVQQEMDNVDTAAGSSSTHPAGGSGTSDEEEIVLPLISMPGSSEAYDFNRLFGPLSPISGETEHDINRKHICRNSCSPDEDNIDTTNSMGVLVELGCHCRGSMSRMCIKCLLKWFGPRIMLDKDMTCEICQTLLRESVRKTVLSALADHTGGRDILVEALGPRVVRTHQARSDYAHSAYFQVEDAVVEEVPFASHGAAVGEHGTINAPDEASDTPADTPASDTPASSSPASNQQRSRSFFTKIRRYMCCAAPSAPV